MYLSQLLPLAIHIIPYCVKISIHCVNGPLNICCTECYEKMFLLSLISNWSDLAQIFFSCALSTGHEFTALRAHLRPKFCSFMKATHSRKCMFTFEESHVLDKRNTIENNFQAKQLDDFAIYATEMVQQNIMSQIYQWICQCWPSCWMLHQKIYKGKHLV